MPTFAPEKNFSSIISLLLVAALVSTDREVLDDVSQSIQAAIAVFTTPEGLFVVESPSRMVYPSLPAGDTVERSRVGPYRGELPAHAPRYLSEHTDVRASEILFHNGCGYFYGASRGCQVLPPGEMQRFIEVIGPNTGFDYLLIDANLKLGEVAFSKRQTA